MKIEFDGNWKVLAIVVGFIVLVFLAISTVFGLLAELLVFILKGLWAFIKFGFSSIAGFAVLVVAAYLIYQGYEKLKGEGGKKEETIEYTNEDFER